LSFTSQSRFYSMNGCSMEGKSSFARWAPQENRVLWRNVTLKLSGEVSQAALAFLAFRGT
jgi:hypothetical protein